MKGAFATTHFPENPTATLAMGDELTGFDREMFLHVVVDNWSQKDPSAAWDWVLDNQDTINSHYGRIITEVMADLTRGGLNQAEEAMETLTEPDHRQFAIVGMARALSFNQGTKAAVTWANIPSEAEKDTAHGIIAQIAPKGIGTVLAIEIGFPKVTGLVDHGAAALDGRIEVGDRIVAVESGQGHFELLYGQPMQRALDLLRGEAGSTLKLRLVRNDNNGNAIDQLVELERQQIVLPKVSELHSSD
jgi:C-terminal processing protease CtpA/Prc